MITEGERIKELRLVLRLNQREFADIFGVSRSFISAVEKNISYLSKKNLHKLLTEYDINLNWLIAGVGNMFNCKDDLDKKVEQKVKEALSKYGLTDSP